jgi:hypothetical protein
VSAVFARTPEPIESLALRQMIIKTPDKQGFFFVIARAPDNSHPFAKQKWWKKPWWKSTTNAVCEMYKKPQSCIPWWKNGGIAYAEL